MVGELAVAIADQTATIEFLDDRIVFCFQDYASARAVSKRPFPDLSLVGKLLSFGELRLQAQIGKRKPIELFPQAGWLIRVLSPEVRELARSARS